MDKIVIQGRRPLRGKVKVSGSKNAALPILAASLLTHGKSEIRNLPDLADIHTMGKLLKDLGLKFQWWGGKARLHANGYQKHVAAYNLVRTMRASVLVLGPLVARLGKAKVSLPGGCAIGARPIHLHLKGLEAMGAKIRVEHGYVEAEARRLHGAVIHFDTVSVTGTENLMMAATLAEGRTLLENAAREPEVVDLANFLNAMGAKVQGAGTSTIAIEGVEKLQGGAYSVMPDRIEAGTFLIAGCLPGSRILLQGIAPEYVESLLVKLQEAGAKVEIKPEGIHLTAPKKLQAVDISTAPYPGFATDLQAQFMALMSVAGGSSVIRENIFENRFMHVGELIRMGAEIKLEGNSAVVRGVETLSGAPIMATDLRASASLVIAGLAAEGITEITRVYHIDRGYEKIEKKFRKLGARVKRVKVKY
ncbi:MAG TPA: UDP-N-acetylglucosamine 1-carboxyvinyltransferase [Deltaproteobacteria bacterium]|nr:UDP-N-acetylglucosamine 1-carboxyvinyltransferase [Deltaproteobacteria bacterium]